MCRAASADDFLFAFRIQITFQGILWRIPKPFNLRSDPFERADTDSNNYDHWWIERSAFSVTSIQEIVTGFIGTFKDFPPRQKPAKFNVDDVMATMYKTGAH